MLIYRLGPLPDTTEDWLAERAKLVAAAPTRAAKHKLARGLFGGNGRHFTTIRDRLAAASPAGQACFYCERDRYRDIDHIRPVRHFPDACFVWSNYVYACTICNQDAKRDRYGIIGLDGQLVVLDHSWPIEDVPPEGVHAIIDIRHEDAFEFMTLDTETGRFVPNDAIDDPVAKQRARFTLDVLRLNTDNLSRFRRQAYVAFSNYLIRFHEALAAGEPNTANRVLEELQELSFPTVLAEMRRQSSKLPNLAPLIMALPPHVGTRNARNPAP